MNLPPSTVNNSRAIVRQTVARFNNYPSSFLSQKIEQLTGVDMDFSDKDWGNDPELIEQE